MNTQLEFLYFELTTIFQKEWDAILNSECINEITMIFMLDILSPSDKSEKARENRVKLSEYNMELFSH
jgi:hypothetical protein